MVTMEGPGYQEVITFPNVDGPPSWFNVSVQGFLFQLLLIDCRACRPAIISYANTVYTVSQ